MNRQINIDWGGPQIDDRRCTLYQVIHIKNKHEDAKVKAIFKEHRQACTDPVYAQKQTQGQ